MRDLVGEKFVRNSFDDIMFDLTHEFNHPDFVCKPRGNEIKEILVPRLVLANPYNRVISSKTRKPNYGFAVGEFLWYWRGSESLDEMTYYNKRMPAFSDDGKTLNSAYGKRIRAAEVGTTDRYPLAKESHSQWSVCVKTLKDDKDSRRALLLINEPHDQFKAATAGSKDVPCTLSLQFFIRNNRLHCHANMRSNDVHWGLTYDLFSFTLLQECMLLELQKEYPELTMGRYFHTAGSLHIYEHHYEMTNNMRHEYRREDNISEPMAKLDSLEDLDNLAELEKSLRVDGKDLAINSSNTAVNWMAFQLVQHRKKRDEEKK